MVYAMTRASAYAWCNGELCEREVGAPSVASISFHLGIGVFDGLMAYWNDGRYYLHHCEDHLTRLCAGSATMGLQIPWSIDEMTRGIEGLLRLEPIGTQYVRPIVFRRAPELWITGSEGRPVDVSIFTVRVERDVDPLLACQVSPIERISSRSIPAQTKVCGAYVNSFVARRCAEADGFDDGLMIDRHGRLTEASAANVFLISDGRLLTPATLNPDVFPGITRSVIRTLAVGCGIDVDERDLTVRDLATIDGAFLCSTLMEIRGLSRIAEREMGTADSAVYREILNAFRKYTHA
jgi:branched-chain amino acid aminotransferase